VLVAFDRKTTVFTLSISKGSSNMVASNTHTPHLALKVRKRKGASTVVGSEDDLCHTV
jgi:hypothetical protein